jgi:hypothetical protein
MTKEDYHPQKSSPSLYFFPFRGKYKGGWARGRLTKTSLKIKFKMIINLYNYLIINDLIDEMNKLFKNIALALNNSRNENEFSEKLIELEVEIKEIQPIIYFVLARESQKPEYLIADFQTEFQVLVFLKNLDKVVKQHLFIQGLDERNEEVLWFPALQFEKLCDNF